MIARFILLLIFFFSITKTEAQKDEIYSKDGKPVLNRRQLVFDCLRSLNKDRSDTVAVNICECRADKIDRSFSLKQFKKHTSKGLININNLIKEDSSIAKEIDNCYAYSGKTVLLRAEGFKDNTIASCVETIQKYSNKKLDSARLVDFCTCQFSLVRSKKMTDEDYRQLSNPNSLFFYEVIYKCGDPFGKSDSSNEWKPKYAKDISGALTDTINVLTINGMTYVKIKTGSMVQFWLFDTGATDLLINNETEVILKKENVIVDSNYMGIAEYEMANGVIDTCRKYTINNVRIGKFFIDNIVVAVSDKAKRIIVGKALMNKFSNWTLDNKNKTLILSK